MKEWSPSSASSSAARVQSSRLDPAVTEFHGSEGGDAELDRGGRIPTDQSGNDDRRILRYAFTLDVIVLRRTARASSCTLLWRVGQSGERALDGPHNERWILLRDCVSRLVRHDEGPL